MGEGEREGGFQREVSDEGGLVGGGLWRNVIIMMVVAVLLIGQVWLSGIVINCFCYKYYGFGGIVIGEILVGQVCFGGIVILLLLLLSILWFWRRFYWRDMYL